MVFDDENTMSFSGASGWQRPTMAKPARAQNIELFMMLILNDILTSRSNEG